MNLPIEIDLWTTEQIGDYLKMVPKQVSERIVCLPGFPQPIRLPTVKGGKGNPRWKAIEVVRWVESFQETRAA